MCHYCGWRTPFDAKCGKCGGALELVGAGTQKIEEEAAALFPSARIARLDSDTASAAGRENEIIREFSRKKIDILVGTQIIAKGFDFDGLSMVAVTSQAVKLPMVTAAVTSQTVKLQAAMVTVPHKRLIITLSL